MMFGLERKKRSMYKWELDFGGIEAVFWVDFNLKH